MSIRKMILAAAVAAAAVPAAFADTGSRWVGGELGFESHAVQGPKTRAQVRAELEQYVRDGGSVASSELDYLPPHQHNYIVREGRTVHADDAAAMGNGASGAGSRRAAD